MEFNVITDIARALQSATMLAVVAAYFLNGQCCDGRHSRLFEVASFAGPDQFVQRLDLALKPRVVPQSLYCGKVNVAVA